MITQIEIDEELSSVVEYTRETNEWLIAGEMLTVAGIFILALFMI